jgi:hypothetical protein
VSWQGGIREGKRGMCAPFGRRREWMRETVVLPSAESRELYCDMCAQIETRDLLVMTY